MHRLIKKLLQLAQTHWLPLTLLLMGIIAVLSLTPLPALPRISGSDKTHHFIAYAALAYPVSLAAAAFAQPKRVWFVLLAMVVFSGCIELIQPFVNRYGEWLDMAANVGGLLCGYALAKLTCSLFYKNTDFKKQQIQ